MGPAFSVAYAGHANQALDAIRGAVSILKDGGPDAAVEHLRQASADTSSDIDFIVAAHKPEPELRRVWQGRASEPLAHSLIGDPSILPEVERRYRPADGGKEDAKNFRLAFIAAFTDRKVHVDVGVGGFPLSLVARPEGHLYKWHSLSHSWKPIVPTGGTTYEDENDLLTGEWSFRHDLMTINQPGVAVLAVEVLQAKTGFVYAPLLEDDPSPVRLLEEAGPYTQHQAEIHAAMRMALDAKVAEHLARFQ
ncbi:MAG: hypothetical protein AB7O44_20070 [Hyphomicrobiaceae bacterium]